MNVKKIISLIMLLFMLLPLGAQNSEGKQRYKIAACDWMMLKRQKIGSFQLMKELGGDGIEMDMGGLGKRDTFDNKFHQLWGIERSVFFNDRGKWAKGFDNQMV